MDKCGVRVVERILRRSLWGVRLVEDKRAQFKTSLWCARLLLCRLLRQRPRTKWPRWRGVEGGGGHGNWGGHECTRWGAEWDQWEGGIGGGERGIFILFFGVFFFPFLCVFVGVTHMHAHSREIGGSVGKM